MLSRMIIFMLSVAVLLLLMERTSVTRVTPDATPDKPKRAAMAFKAINEDDYWKQKTDNLLSDVKQGRAEKNLTKTRSDS